ncbi:A-macroglobulin complement component [compost metagenome]
MTGYVLYGLAEARRAGASVPDAAVTRAIDYLKRQLPTIKKDVFTRQTVERNAGADLRALALFGLAQWRQAPDAEINRLWADRAALSHYGMAQLALVLAEKGDMRRFEALDTLEKSVSETETQASWPSTAAAYSWQDNATEATAYALRAYLAISPEAPKVAKVVRWLESKNVQGYWESTKDTGAAAIALADYIAVRKPDPAPAGLRVRVNDQEVATVGAAVGDPWAPLAPITLGADKLHEGPNVVFVEADGAGVDYTGTLRYVRQADNLPAAPLEGLKVERTYFHLPADVYARAKGEGSFANFYDDKLVATLPKLGRSVKAGERVLVRVTLTATKGYRYMVAEDPLPAGCEVLEDQPPNWGYWWDHQEYRDEKAAFFFNRLEPGTKTLYYVMRPTTQGRFRVLPPRVWAMYTPELRARGAADTLTITE